MSHRFFILNLMVRCLVFYDDLRFILLMSVLVRSVIMHEVRATTLYHPMIMSNKHRLVALLVICYLILMVNITVF